MEYIKAIKSQNAYALWEERSEDKATAIFDADGMPATALEKSRSSKKVRQALVQVKKDMYIVSRQVKEVKVYQVVYPFTNKSGQHLIKARLINEKHNGRWRKSHDTVVKKMAQAVEQKLKKDTIVSQPLTIPIFKSANGYHILYEQCGAECSTIVCSADGRPAKSVFMFTKPGIYGRQAVVPVFPHFKVLQGHRTPEGYEISIYEILRTFTGAKGPEAEVILKNHCVNGQWQNQVSQKVLPLTISLVDKIEGTDTRTILSKMH